MTTVSDVSYNIPASLREAEKFSNTLNANANFGGSPLSYDSSALPFYILSNSVPKSSTQTPVNMSRVSSSKSPAETIADVSKPQKKLTFSNVSELPALPPNEKRGKFFPQIAPSSPHSPNPKFSKETNEAFAKSASFRLENQLKEEMKNSPSSPRSTSLAREDSFGSRRATDVPGVRFNKIGRDKPFVSSIPTSSQIVFIEMPNSRLKQSRFETRIDQVGRNTYQVSQFERNPKYIAKTQAEARTEHPPVEFVQKSLKEKITDKASKIFSGESAIKGTTKASKSLTTFFGF